MYLLYNVLITRLSSTDRNKRKALSLSSSENDNKSKRTRRRWHSLFSLSYIMPLNHTFLWPCYILFVFYQSTFG